jgi:hypothetical protein
MINPRAKLVTRDGQAAEFVCDERHPVFPLIFSIAGRLHSYTREGCYLRPPESSPLDLVEAR